MHPFRHYSLFHWFVNVRCWESACNILTITSRANKEMNVHWFVLLASAVNKTQPFLRPYYIDAIVVLYAFVQGFAYVLSNSEEWVCKLSATSSKDRLVFFQCIECIVAVPYVFASIYLLFPLVIPIWVFYTCLIIGVFGKRLVEWQWEKQMLQLNLG